ncbi:PEP-CTERM sorting domain-containing protein [Marinobacter sp. NFXS9]|uniref:PEP-CTERM sorting domain-containing protein n=1 Tax=Marinobacter sp. NFXS9 TaxID=2818433 RepID=UPI0032DE761D
MKKERVLSISAGIALGVSSLVASVQAAPMLYVSSAGESAAQAAETNFLAKLKSGYLTEDFESYTAGTTSQSNSIATSVGTFTQDVAGSGGDCGNLGFTCNGGVAILDDGSSPFGGRFATPSGSDNANWLDSMDSEEMTFSLTPGFNALGFYITDPNDVGGRMTVGSTTFTFEDIFGSALGNGNVFYITLFDSEGLGDVTFYANASDDGYGIDNVTVGEVPEPGSLALLGLGLAGIGVMRRRKA